MKVNLSFAKLFLITILTLAMTVPLFAARDDFNRADGPLGGNWAANTNLVIESGRMHNQGTTTGWDNYLAVFNVVDANEATIFWPSEGNGISGDGAQLGGVSFVNSFSAGSDGYLIYVYGNELRLFEISNGSPTGNNIQPDINVSTNPQPGDEFKVTFNSSTYTFTVYVNGTQIGSIQDPSKRVSLGTRYAGVMLYKLDSNPNDVEAFQAEYVPPSNDTTPPGTVTDLSASTASSSSATLTWTAVGDDGNTGTASQYDLRRSKNNILTDTDFNNATQVTGLPAPKQVGQSESVNVTGLEASTKYYFALKVKDEASNTSDMSNVASVTTTEGGGGGGGGGSTGQLTWKIDDFERDALGADWSASNYTIDQGELALATKTNGWNNIALYQTAGAYGAAMTFSPENSALYSNSYIPAGLLVLMDSPNPATANGYLLKRVSNGVDVFQVTGGVVGSSAVGHSSSQAVPQPGDKVRAEITDNGTSKTVKYYVRGQLDATFDINDSAPMDNRYVGVSLYGGSGFFNNISSFEAGYAGGSGAQNIAVYGGNNQSGPINQQLPQPIQVLVSDENEEPAPETLLEFQLIQGEARFDDIEDFVFEGQVWKEAEEGRLLLPQARIDSDEAASGGQFVTYDWIAYQTRFKLLAVPFYIPEDGGRYDLWVRSRTLSDDNFRFHYSLDAETDSVLVEMPRTNIGSWVWVRLDNNVPINSGMHDLNLIPYHAELQWDKILVQQAGMGAPSGTGGVGPDFPNMTDENGIGSTRVTFGENADDDVIVYVYAYRNDGSKVEQPAVFTLDPTPGPAVAMERDPSVPDPVNATPGLESPPLKVIIKDEIGNRVDGVTLNWRVSQGDGTMTSPTSISDSVGVAFNTLQLNYYQETDYQVQASVTGLTGSPVTFTIAPGAPPHRIVLVQPTNRQESNVNTTLDSLLIVRVLKEDDTPFEGYPVEFNVTQGDGSISTQNGSENALTLEIPTDVQGYSRAVWTLGGPGLNLVEARASNLDGNPVEFEAWAQTGEPANFVKEDGDNQEGAVGMPLGEPFVAKVTDSNGFPISEQEIEFEIMQGQGAYFGQSGIRKLTRYTNNLGEAEVTLTLGSVINEEHVVKASAIGTSLSPLYFRATPTGRIAKSLEYVSGNGTTEYQKAVVTNTLANSFVVKAVDPYDNPTSNQTVTFKVMNGGGTFENDLPEITKQTDAQGLARATLTLGTLAGDSVHVVHASAKRSDVPDQSLEGSPVVFKASGLPKPPARLTKVDSTDNQTGEVGFPLTDPIQVKITDEHANPIKSHPVTFKVVNQGGELEDASGKASAKVVSTNAAGIASVIWHMPTTPGVVNVDVSSSYSGTALQDSPATFTANAVVGQPDKMVRITPDSVMIGTVWKPLEERLKVQIVDRLGNPLVGKPVTFTVKQGGGLLNGLPQVTIQTADSGYASVEWTLGKTAGVEANVVEATASVNVNPTITFVATGLPDAAFRLVADSSYTTYGTVGALLPDPIFVKIADQHGNGVPDHVVDFEIVPVNDNAGYISEMGITTKRDTTDDDGMVQVRWGLGPDVGSQNNKLRAIAKKNQNNLVNSPYVFIASATVGGATKIVKMTNDSALSSIIGNTLSEYLKIKVTDDYDNPIARHPVRFEVISRKAANGGTLDGLVDSVKVKQTDSNGMAWVQFTLGQRAGYNINKVQVSADNGSGVPLDGSPILFEITGTSTNAKKIAISDGDDQTGFVGQYLPRDLRVMAMDQYNNPSPGQPIRFRILADDSITGESLGSLGPGAAVDTSVNTNEFGIAAIKWRLGHDVGSYQVEATSFGDGPLEGSPLMFDAIAKADLTSPDSSIVRVVPSEMEVSDGSSRAMVIVVLRDKFNNPVSGKAVSIQVTGNGNLITQPTNTSDDNGRTLGYVASREAGHKYVTARDLNSGVSLSDSAEVTFTPAAAQQIVKAPGNNGDTQTRNVGTVLEDPLRVLVTDQFGNPRAGIPVTFRAVSGGGRLIENQPVLTDSVGIASAHYRLGMQPGANLIEASASGLQGSPVNFSAIAVEPQQIQELVIMSGDQLAGGPGQDLPEPLAVQVLDNVGWPVNGRQVKFEVLANDAVITSENPVASNMYGMASAEMKLGTSLGLNIIRASLVDLPNIAVIFNDTTKVIPGSGATSIQMYAGNNQNGYVAQTLPTPLTVKVTDAYNNPVPEYTVSFSVVDDQTVDGVGTLEGGVKALARKTDQFGLAKVYYTLGNQAGMNNVRASATGLQPEFVEFTLTSGAASAYTMRKWSGDDQTGEMGRVLLKPITVRFEDRHGNPARGGSVKFVVTQGGGSILEPQPVLSDANGLATVHWKLGPRPNAYQNELRAIADGLPVGTVVETYTATGDPSRWPKLQLPPERYINENAVLTFGVYATDSDNPPITCSVKSMPDSAEFINNNDGTWTFTWRPDYSVVQSPANSKEFYAVFEAVDLKGGKDIDSVKIVVNNRNRPPQITRYWPQGDLQKIDPSVESKKEFGVETFDPDGDVVTVTWFVDGNQVAYGNTFTMDFNVYPPNNFHTVRVQVNDYSRNYNHYWGVKVPVELVSFSSSVTPYEGVHLEWETANESNNAGFNVLRSLKETGDYVKINEELIPARQDGLYDYLDSDIAAGYSYYYKVEDVSKDGSKTVHGPVKAEAPVPKEYKLAQNYPNPFNPSTTIRFDVPQVSHITLEVYNILGQKVRTLMDREMQPGYHIAVWDGLNDYGMRVSSGVYYYRISANEFSDVKKMAILK